MTTFVDKTTDGGNVTNLAPVWPGGLATLDVALLWWLMNNTSTPTTPSGFALVATPGLVDGDSGAMRMGLYVSTLTGSEAGTLALNGTAIHRQCAAMAIYRGAHPTAPISGTVTVRDEGAAVTAHPCPAVTPLHDGCTIVTAAGERSTTGTTNWGAPSGYAERADTDSLATGTGGTICAIADDGLATSHPASAAVTPPDWTGSLATANVLTWSVALRPVDSSRPPRLVGMTPAVRRAASW